MIQESRGVCWVHKPGDYLPARWRRSRCRARRRSEHQQETGREIAVTSRTYIWWAVISAALLAPATAAAAGRVASARAVDLNETGSEVAVAVKATVTGLDAEKLQRCIYRQVDRRLPLEGDSNKVFAPVSWTAEEKRILNTCNLSKCKYEFPDWGIKRLMKAQGLHAKQEVYYDLLHYLSVKARKKSKPHRIRLSRLRREPCAGTGSLRWLLDSRPGKKTRLAWRKMKGDSRMRPTVITFHVHGWDAGETRCVGRTMLFADHYYDDHLELVAIEPAGSDKLRVRLLIRSRFAFIDSWWERKTVKWGIRKAVKKHSIRELKRWVRSCR
jgi:hypothetical protein